MNTVTFDGQQVTPSKVLCVARNYVAHIEELGNEVPDELPLFIKPNSAISSELRAPGQRCRYETEIALLMNRGQVAGVGVGLDLTLVDVQTRLKQRGLPWEKAKAYDGSAVFSAFVPTPENLATLRVTLDVDGTRRQDGGVELMIHKPPRIVAEILESFSLEDGDLIMTGTPEGVGDVIAGERYEASLFDGDRLLVRQAWTAR